MEPTTKVEPTVASPGSMDTEERIKELKRSLDTILRTLEEIRLENAQHTATLESASYAGDYACLCRAPDIFEGKPNTIQTFLYQVRLFFSANGSLFPTDRRKIDYVLLSLRGSASDWSMPLVERRTKAEESGRPENIPIELSTWPKLAESMLNHWGSTTRRRKRSNQFRRKPRAHSA